MHSIPTLVCYSRGVHLPNDGDALSAAYIPPWYIRHLTLSAPNAVAMVCFWSRTCGSSAAPKRVAPEEFHVSRRARLVKIGSAPLEKFFARPVLVESIWQISSNDQRDLLLAELFESNLQRIGLGFHVNKYRCSHTIAMVRYRLRLVLQPQTHLICNARVPSTRARSYFVM